MALKPGVNAGRLELFLTHEFTEDGKQCAEEHEISDRPEQIAGELLVKEWVEAERVGPADIGGIEVRGRRHRPPAARARLGSTERLTLRRASQ